jgi:hypothetical protein
MFKLAKDKGREDIYDSKEDFFQAMNEIGYVFISRMVVEKHSLDLNNTWRSLNRYFADYLKKKIANGSIEKKKKKKES